MGSNKRGSIVTFILLLVIIISVFIFGIGIYSVSIIHSSHIHVENDGFITNSKVSNLIKYDKISQGFKNTKVVWPEVKPYDASAYPVYNSLLSIIESWNPDNPDPPSIFYETLQHFNYSDPYERSLAEKYRNEEIPFKLYNVPEFQQVHNKWTDEYLIKEMRTQGTQHVEKSISNHFMFWNMRGKGMKNFIPPTEIVKLSFEDWLQEAYAADHMKLSNDSTHYYFMTGCQPGDGHRTFISRDLSLFSTSQNNFFITNVEANKGIQCRFSMRGIIAESHFDSGKNMVAMIKGAKRYIITPPRTCTQIGIITDIRHPSYRHSVIDWSDISQARSNHFNEVDAIDTIVQENEILYIPSYWFHYIISLQYSIQCNSRSGAPLGDQGLDEIEQCMGGAVAGLRRMKASNNNNNNKKRKNY